jgi:hypothetical protein
MEQINNFSIADVIPMINNLMYQIEISDFQDEHGHKIKMNSAYLALKELYANKVDNKQSYIISMNDGSETIVNTNQSIKEISNHIVSDDAIIIGDNIFRSSLINSVVKCKKQ